MVLSQHRGFRFSFAVDDGANTLNPLRILAVSAALALHAAVLLVLLAPATMPPQAEVTERLRTPPDIPKVKVDPPPIVDPLPKVPVNEKPRTTATPQQTVAVDTPVISDRPADVYVPTIADAGPDAPANIEPAAPSPVQLAYLEAPPPPYPRAAQTGHREGVVMLQITVDVDGRPISVEIAQSSGHRDLDAAARNHVLKHWRFQPAMKDGQAIQAIGMVPINFQLN